MCCIDWLCCGSYAPILELGTGSQINLVDWRGIVTYSRTKNMDVGIKFWGKYGTGPLTQPRKFYNGKSQLRFFQTYLQITPNSQWLKKKKKRTKTLFFCLYNIYCESGKFSRKEVNMRFWFQVTLTLLKLPFNMLSQEG